jgi:hypothetical protein
MHATGTRHLLEIVYCLPISDGRFTYIIFTGICSEPDTFFPSSGSYMEYSSMMNVTSAVAVTVTKVTGQRIMRELQFLVHT